MNVTLDHPRQNFTYEAIPSKSVAHRALILSAFCERPTKIFCPVYGKDIEATISCLNTIGADIKISNDGFLVYPIKELKSGILNCMDSATTYRFFDVITKDLGLNCTLHGTDRLLERVYSKANTSQYLSGKLISRAILSSLGRKSSFTEEEFNKEFSEVSSKAYVNVTRTVLRDFGFLTWGDKLETPRNYTVEGDWSLSSLWLALGALTTRGVSVKGLNPYSSQGDSEMITILRQFGARVSILGTTIDVNKSFNGMEPQKLDGAMTPDLVPIIAILSCFAKGVTEIRNIDVLKYKESDRIETTVEMINSLGGKAEISDNSILIMGQGRLPGGTVNSNNDHRIAMAAAIASYATDGPVTIIGADAVSKSYPQFFDIVK